MFKYFQPSLVIFNNGNYVIVGEFKKTFDIVFPTMAILGLESYKFKSCFEHVNDIIFMLFSGSFQGIYNI